METFTIRFLNMHVTVVIYIRKAWLLLVKESTFLLAGGAVVVAVFSPKQ
jgi:hypothetical protein